MTEIKMIENHPFIINKLIMKEKMWEWEFCIYAFVKEIKNWFYSLNLQYKDREQMQFEIPEDMENSYPSLALTVKITWVKFKWNTTILNVFFHQNDQINTINDLLFKLYEYTISLKYLSE